MDNVELIIREATETDIEALTDIYLDGAKYQFSLNKQLYSIPSRASVLAYNKKQFDKSPIKNQIRKGVTLVASYNGEVVGVIGVTLHRHEAHSLLRAKMSAELDISVKETMRSHGVGTQLIQAAEAWAQKHGADRIVLNTYVGNERAINFYTKHNHFQAIGLILAKPVRKAKKTA